jgi:ABC-type transporter Mla subunit MlaD
MPESYTSKYDQRNANNQFVDTAESGANLTFNQNNYTSEPKKTLAEAAAEIQNLLKQLEQNNPTATESDQITHINGETSPNFKRRVASALQAGGETAIDEFILDNKYLKVVKAAIKGWLEPDS